MSSFMQELWILFLCFQTLFCNSYCDLSLHTLTKCSAPGLKAPKKLWWSKELTPDLHTAGGLTEKQIKQVADGGFKSIISLCIDTKHGDFGGEYLPTAFEARHIAKLSKLQYEAVLTEDEEWASVEAVKKLTAAIQKLPKPILLHCNRAYTITFTTLLYLANASRHDASFTPQVNSEQFYKMCEHLGFDFTNETLKAVVSEITGEPVVNSPPRPNAIPDDWLDYWLGHPIYKNWYSAGQIRKGHIQELEFIGFKSVINMRQGTTSNGKPSQETVTLINIKDGTPTYDSDFEPLRQLDSNLKTLVLDPKKEPNYISPTSDVNYERRNFEEWGDDIGYNQDLQSEDFKDSELNYYHLPIDSEVEYNKDVFGQYKDKLLEIGRQGPVLIHCASGKRVAYIGVLAAALQYDKDFNWAIQRIAELGFEVSRTKNRDVYEMFSAWLNPDHGNKTEL